MIGKLYCFEIMKKWRSAKYLLLGYLGIQTLILLITRAFLWNSELSNAFTINGDPVTNNASLPFILTMVLFFILAFLLGAFPFLEGIYRFERDLSGKQAYLELMIPAVSWKKVVAKLLATLSSLVVCGMVSLLSMFIYITVNFNAQAFIREMLADISKNWLQVIPVLLYMLFSFASSFMLIFFCITIAKSFTHKNTIAVPIGIAAFLILCGLIAALGIQVGKVPLMEFRFILLKMIVPLSRILLDIVVFLAAIIGTSWLMEKRVEH